MPGEIVACDCSATSSGTTTCGADATFGACGQCSIPDPDPQKVNFQAQIVPIFNRSCGAGDIGCHARNQYAANNSMDCRGWLTLENASLGSIFYSGPSVGQSTGCPDKTLYERLMAIAPWQCASTTSYVKPNNLGASYIVNKITATGLCEVEPGKLSDSMPPPQPDNPNPYTLSTADRDLIKQWVSEGALDN